MIMKKRNILLANCIWLFTFVFIAQAAETQLPSFPFNSCFGKDDSSILIPACL